MKKIIQMAALAVAALLARATNARGPDPEFHRDDQQRRWRARFDKDRLFRWSTDMERDRLVAAWTNPVAPAPAGRGGRGRGAPARGPALSLDDPSQAGVSDGNPVAAGGRSGGRGGRGGGASVPEAPATPESSLTAALGKRLPSGTCGHRKSLDIRYAAPSNSRAGWQPADSAHHRSPSRRP